MSESTAVGHGALFRTVLLEVLKKNKKGFVLSELAAKAIEAGYKSPLENFQDAVYRCRYHTPEIERNVLFLEKVISGGGLAACIFAGNNRTD